MHMSSVTKVNNNSSNILGIVCIQYINVINLNSITV